MIDACDRLYLQPELRRAVRSGRVPALPPDARSASRVDAVRRLPPHRLAAPGRSGSAIRARAHADRGAARLLAPRNLKDPNGQGPAPAGLFSFPSSRVNTSSPRATGASGAGAGSRTFGLLRGAFDLVGVARLGQATRSLQVQAV
jgi:hypothetical protein